MSTIDRKSAIDAVDLLNDLVGDISTGVMVFREYDQQYRAGHLTFPMMVGIQKMCFSHIILSLTKWLEIYKKYHFLFPPEAVTVCRNLNKVINQRKILNFRNVCIGHIWNKKTQSPLFLSEIMSRLEIIAGGNLTEFLKWLNNPEGNIYPNTVVSIIVKIRDKIVVKYKIKPDEVINR